MNPKDGLRSSFLLVSGSSSYKALGLARAAMGKAQIFAERGDTRSYGCSWRRRFCYRGSDQWKRVRNGPYVNVVLERLGERQVGEAGE